MRMDWKKGWRDLSKEVWFKRVYASIGTIMIILSFVIMVDPEPFLQFGYWGVFAFNLFGPGTLLIPTLSLNMDILILAIAAGAGMALNDSLSWVVGYGGRAIIKPSLKTEKVERGIKKYGIWAILFWSIVPFPFDFVGLIAGYLRFPYGKMLITAFIGKVIRFTLLGLGTNWIVGII